MDGIRKCSSQKILIEESVKVNSQHSTFNALQLSKYSKLSFCLFLKLFFHILSKNAIIVGMRLNAVNILISNIYRSLNFLVQHSQSLRHEEIFSRNKRIHQIS